MPSQFEELFDSCASPLMESIDGEAVGYRQRGKETAYDDCVGIWNPNEFINPLPDENGRVEKASGELWIRKAWYAKKSFLPARGDDVTVQGKLYAVMGVNDGGDGWFTLVVGSTKRTETSDGPTRRGGQR
jgi:hypothetical protein